MLPLLLIQIFTLFIFAQGQGQSFSYLTLGITPGVTRQYLSRVDDGASSSIPILGGFRFGTSSMTNVYVGTNGYFSFGTRRTVYNPSLFSSTSPYSYLVAPFWADIDITVHGSISYEVHSTSAGSSSIALLNRVSTFISNQQNTQFSGNWMLVASWSQVSAYSGSSSITNTFQGIVITNGTSSYAVFMYECGDINWGGGATIGFKATGSFYQNHTYSGSRAASIDCVNSPTSRWNNVVYRLNGIGAGCTSSQFQCTNGQCISSSSRCNGVRTCSDGSDEMNCSSCSGFLCNNRQCIPSSDRCDSTRDCTDGSDESGCCTSSQFRCSNGHCISSSSRCNGYRTCSDGSDEMNCYSSCTGFHCSNYQCIPSSDRCNGVQDCTDGSDETRCCTSSQFRCSNGHCISSSSRCNGYRTCSDGSDEMNCYSSCSGFRCNNYQCISSSDHCDGTRDCTDGSDETGCCTSSQFRCSNGQCISSSSRCNGYRTCSDGSDEMNCLSCSGFHCNNRQCISSSDHCDGTRDCIDGSDESNCFDILAARRSGITVGSILGTLFLVTVFWCIAFCICLQVSTCPLHNVYYKRTIQNLAEAPPIQGQPQTQQTIL